jgi:hypothetical protein
MMRKMIAAVTVLACAAAASAQSLHLSSAVVEQPGQPVDLCVALDSEGSAVAGTQNDLVWDGGCATLDEDGCQIAPGTGKQLFGRIQSGPAFRYRAVVLSLDDVDPIDDGTLYCCPFRVDATPGSCCPVTLDAVGMSDPRGNAVVVTGGPRRASLCVAGDSSGAPPTPTPTPSPLPTRTCAVPADCASGPHADDVAAGGGDGCQTVGGRSGPGVLLIALPVLALIRRRRWR